MTNRSAVYTLSRLFNKSHFKNKNMFHKRLMIPTSHFFEFVMMSSSFVLCPPIYYETHVLITVLRCCTGYKVYLWPCHISFHYSTLSNRPHGSNSRHGATDSEKLIKNMDQINVMELGRWWKIIKDMDRIDVMIVVNISHFSKSNYRVITGILRYGLILRHYKWRLKLRHGRVCHSWK